MGLEKGKKGVASREEEIKEELKTGLREKWRR